MAFDPDEYLAGGIAAVAEPESFDPDEYLGVKAEQPSFNPDEYLKEGEPYVPAEIQQADEQAEIERNAGRNAPQALKNAANATVELLGEFIPRSAGDVAHLVTPVMGAVDDIKRGYNIAKDIAGGKSAEEAVTTHAPDYATFTEAAKTELLSKERFKAGFGTVAQMLMAGGIAKSLKPKADAPLMNALAQSPEIPLVQTVAPDQSVPAPVENPAMARFQPESMADSGSRTGADVAPLSDFPKQESAAPRMPEVVSESVAQPETTIPAAEIASPEPTSTKNAVTTAEREARGIPEAVEAARRDFGTVWEQAEVVAKADPGAPVRLVESLKENPRALTDHENALLLRRQIEVQAEHDVAVKAVNEAPDTVSKMDAQARLDRVRDDLQVVYDAAKVAGTETGRGLAARKMLANDDYSLAKMEATTRAVINNGEPLKPKQLEEVRVLHERIKTAEEKISAYEAREEFNRALREAKKEAAKTGFKAQTFLEQQADRARQRIIERRGRLHADPLGVTQIAHLADEAIIGASYVAKGIRQFNDWSKQMIAEFGERIKPHLQALFAKAQELHSQTHKRPVLTPEERQSRGLAADKKAIQTRIQKIQEKTAAGDFSKPEKVPRMDKEKADLLFEYTKAKEAYNRKLFQAKLDAQSVPRKVLRYGGEVVNTARAMMTSFDLSAVFRQGGFITLGHPIRALRSFPAMFRAFGSERAQHRINAEIMNRPNGPLYVKSKLYLADESAMSLSKMEEAYMSRWASKIFGVAGSQRAYTTFLNKLRADSFDAMVEGLGRNGKVTLEESRAIANFVNVATGRGDMGGHAQSAVVLNTAFFAPRLVLSRFQLLAGQPMYRGTYQTRMAVAKEYARFLAGAGTVLTLAASAGAKIDTNDPTSTDFLKIRFGNTRLDPFTGLAQVTVFSAREAGAIKRFITQSKEKKPRYGSGGEVLVRFLRTKLSPLFGAGWNALEGKDVVGQKTTPQSVAKQMVVPMSFGDIYKAMQEQGVPKGTALAILSLFGMSLQTHEKKPKR